MNLNRFIEDKEIAQLGEDIMAILMTAKDFGIDSESFIFVVRSLVMKLFIQLSDRKDLTNHGKEETRQYAYGFVTSILSKAVGLKIDPSKDIFMLDYMNANKEKLLNDCLDALNSQPPNLTVN